MMHCCGDSRANHLLPAGEENGFDTRRLTLVADSSRPGAILPDP